jgi:hypothetical protein
MEAAKRKLASRTDACGIVYSVARGSRRRNIEVGHLAGQPDGVQTAQDQPKPRRVSQDRPLGLRESGLVGNPRAQFACFIRWKFTAGMPQ